VPLTLVWASVPKYTLDDGARCSFMADEQHKATIYENRGTDRYDPYVIEEGKFLVGCICGWYSGQVESRDEAFAAARGHTANVEGEVESLFPDR
jgi:hypothetical protein